MRAKLLMILGGGDQCLPVMCKSGLGLEVLRAQRTPAPSNLGPSHAVGRRPFFGHQKRSNRTQDRPFGVAVRPLEHTHRICGCVQAVLNSGRTHTRRYQNNFNDIKGRNINSHNVIWIYFAYQFSAKISELSVTPSIEYLP